MKIKIISEKNINDNLSILTSDDIFGIYDEKLTCFAVYGPDSNEPRGIMTVQIFPEKLFCKASDADKKRASDAIEAAKEAFEV